MGPEGLSYELGNISSFTGNGHAVTLPMYRQRIPGGTQGSCRLLGDA
jgi:hypothetical protein